MKTATAIAKQPKICFKHQVHHTEFNHSFGVLLESVLHVLTSITAFVATIVNDSHY